MLKSVSPLLAVVMLAAGCSKGPTNAPAPSAQEDSGPVIADLRATIARLEQENADLRATPVALLSNVTAAGADLLKAGEALKILETKFPDSAEAKQGRKIVDNLKADRDKREAEAKRLATLGFKALKISPKLAGDDATITLSGVSQARRWISDAYDSQYHYRDAEKGAAFILARVKVESSHKDPKLPGVAVYSSDGAQLKRVANFSYEFVRWKDYGSYLGNYIDYGNDFAHTNVIPMSIGAESELGNLKRPLYLVATKEGCHSRREKRFGTPSISYYGGDCAGLKEILEVGDFSDGRLSLVHRID